MSDVESFSLKSILAADEAAMEALFEGAVPTWQVLLEALVKGDLEGVAPPAVVDALIKREDVDRWGQIAWDATGGMKSAHFIAGLDPQRRFNAWFRAGVLAHRAADDREALRVRLLDLQEQPGDRVCEDAQALVADLERHHPDSELHVHATLILAARLLEQGRWQEALDAAEVTVSQVEAMPPETLLVLKLFLSPDPLGLATRLRAAALIGDLQLEQGFTALEGVIESPPGPVLHTKRLYDFEHPKLTTRCELAFLAQCATRGHQEWLEALEGAAASFADEPAVAAALAEATVRFADLSALERAVLQMITALRRDELLAVQEPFSPGPAVAAMVESLGKLRSDSKEGAVAAVADALMEAPGVEDLFADDATIEVLLRQVFAAVR